MRVHQQLITIVTIILLASNSWARDTIIGHSIKDALESSIAQEKLSGIKFYFGKQKYPKLQKNLGTFTSNKKTNAFNKSDEKACQIAFLSALISLQNRAYQLGGNAVINIQSNYRNKLTSSTTEYQCGAGAIMAGAALKGTIVKIKQ